MPTTPRMLLPYPGADSNQWNAAFDAMVLALDASLYTTREDRNIVVFGGGTMTFTASTGVLTWSAGINLLAAVTGFQWQIPAGQVTLLDGQLFYITVTRAPQNNTTCLPTVGSFTPNQPNGDNEILVGIRIGTVVHFRDGFTIGDGQSKTVFDNTSSGGGGGGTVNVWPVHQTTISYTVLPADFIIAVGAISGPITVSLEASPALGHIVVVKDVFGSAATHNITISGNGNNIDGASTFVVNLSFTSITLAWTGSQWSII